MRLAFSKVRSCFSNTIILVVDRCVKARANARNIVGPNMLRAFAHHVVCCCVLLRLDGSCWMKFETGQTSSNNFQQVATTHNMVCKRSQHVGPNNVASCWPTMLRAFARAFKVRVGKQGRVLRYDLIYRSNRGLFTTLRWLDLNTRGVVKILESYANPRLRLGFVYLSRILPTPLCYVHMRPCKCGKSL